MTPLAEVKDYDDLIRAFRARADALSVSQMSIDDVAGFCQGYVSKLLCPSRTRGITPVTLGPLLSTLGLKLAVLEDPETFAKYASRLQYRNPNLVRHKRSVEQADVIEI